MADPLGEGAGALAGYIDEAVVGGDLVEEGEEALGFGEDTLGEVGVEFEEGVVDAETVVFDAALKDLDELLLAGQAFADLQEVGGCGVYGVVEGDFMGFGATLQTEGFFAEVGNFAVDVEFDVVEVVQLGDELEDLLAEGGTDFKGSGAGVFVELADFVGGFVGVFVDFDFDEFGSAGFEDAPVGEDGGTGGSSERRSGSQQEEKTTSDNRSPESLA